MIMVRGIQTTYPQNNYVTKLTGMMYNDNSNNDIDNSDKKDMDFEKLY